MQLDTHHIHRKHAERHCSNNMQKRLAVGLLILLAGAAACSTVYLQMEVQTQEELSHISCGWPIPFLVSDQSWRDPPLPWDVSCADAGWDDARMFSWSAFIVDMAFFFVVMVGLWWCLRAITGKFHCSGQHDG